MKMGSSRRYYRSIKDTLATISKYILFGILTVLYLLITSTSIISVAQSLLSQAYISAFLWAMLLGSMAGIGLYVKEMEW